MKAHIGVDADSGLVHTVVGTAANVHDVHTEPVVVELHPMEPVLVKVNATVIVIDREIAQEDQAVVILEA